MIPYLRIGSIVALVMLVILSGGSALAETDASAPQETPSSTPGGIPDWQAHLELAQLLVDSGHYGEAAIEYRSVLQAKPDSTQARIGLARSLFWGGQLAPALTELNKVSSKRLSVDDLHMYVELLIAAERHDQAIQALQSYLKQRPDDLKARFKLAELLIAAERHDQAIQELQSYLKQRPDDLKARLNLAEVLSWCRRTRESLKEYETVLQVRPEDRQVRRAYARVLTWAGRNDDAIRELRKSLAQ